MFLDGFSTSGALPHFVSRKACELFESGAQRKNKKTKNK